MTADITRDDVISVAESTKTALLNQWRNNNTFTDKDVMSESGLLSESIGLTSLMLLVTAFGEEPAFEFDKDRAIISEVIEKTVNSMYDEYHTNGFNATPLVPAKLTAEFFTEEHGYLDSITWVVSSLILMRFNMRKMLVDIDEVTLDKAFEMLCSGLKQIIESQSDDGLWGFIAVKPSKETVPETLYYTYSAIATIDDFFNYIVGEIAEVEDEGGFEYKDCLLMKKLDNALGLDVSETLGKIREKTARWLILTALPEMKNVAVCKPYAADSPLRKKLGLWKSQENSRIDNYYGADYIYLYYAYYLVDMLALTDADKTFNEIVNNEKDALEKAFSNMYAIERRYIFKNSEDLFEDLYKATIESAIQHSKSRFIEASHTGLDFWDSDNTASELALVWEHNDEDVMYAVKGAVKHKNSKNITDPALLPMALRSNIDFSYYISMVPDPTVDRIYRFLLKSRSIDSEEGRVADLWDNVNYNLLVTERSIEAIIDYYDYQRKYYPEQSHHTSAVAVVPSSELPVEDQKLLDAINGKIASMRSAPHSDSPCIQKQDADALTVQKLIETLYEEVTPNKDLTDGYSSTDYRYKLVELFEQLFIQMLAKNYRESLNNSKLEYDSKEVMRRISENKGQWKDLIQTILDKKTSVKWGMLYSDLIEGRK